jgi:hypothetical protein
LLDGTDEDSGGRARPTHWVLAYDETKRHLAGTIDGAKVSFARLEFAPQPASGCGAPPP